MKGLLLMIMSLCLITACNEKNYTVEEFFKDDVLRAKFISKCKNGELHREDLNCLNSRKAEMNKIMLGGLSGKKL